MAAAPAAADSIAYVKDGDVWAGPDGSRQQRVTHSGIYSYVSQADTGEMVALAPGERLHKLSRTVRVAGGKLRRNLLVKVTTAGAGRVKAKVLLGRRAIGARSAAVGASGRASLRVKLARAALRRRSAKVTVRVEFRPAGGGAVQRGSARVTLRR